MDIVAQLDRVETEKMTATELDAGVALALGYVARIVGSGIGAYAEIHRDGLWERFSPTSSWEDFGFLLTRLEVVISTHRGDEEDGVQRYWHTTHAFLSGTTIQSYNDVRISAAKSAVAYAKNLDWQMAGKIERPEGNGDEATHLKPA